MLKRRKINNGICLRHVSWNVFDDIDYCRWIATKKGTREMTKETYGEYQFVLEEGVYTITELEKLIADLKKAQAKMSNNLTQSMQSARKAKEK